MVDHINYSYDSSVDALYILVKDYQKVKTIPLNDDVIIDFSEEGKLVGLEILNTSFVLNTSVESLNNITNIDLIVKVTEYQILVNVIFTVAMHDHDELKIANATVINQDNIPIMDTKIASA